MSVMHDVPTLTAKDKAADELAAHFQKAEPRWEKRRKRRRKQFTLEWHRRREIQIVLQHHGATLPDHVIDGLVREKAQIVGDSLALTAEERTTLKITTIRPCDQRLDALRKQKQRERDRKRKCGKQSRAAYLANALSRTKPWEAEGIGRRQWERRRKSHVASTSRTTYSSTLRDIPATPSPATGDTQGLIPSWYDFCQSPRRKPSGRARNAASFNLLTWTPDGPPVSTQLAYLVRLAKYRRLTSGKSVGAWEQAARSELRRVAA
jgi:hypothetical protein